MFFSQKKFEGAYTSPFSDTNELKMALRARNVSGAFEKRAPLRTTLKNRMKMINKDFTSGLCNRFLVSVKFRTLI